MKYAIYAEVRVLVEPPAKTGMVKQWAEETLAREGFEVLTIYPTVAPKDGSSP